MQTILAPSPPPRFQKVLAVWMEGGGLTESVCGISGLALQHSRSRLKLEADTTTMMILDDTKYKNALK